MSIKHTNDARPRVCVSIGQRISSALRPLICVAFVLTCTAISQASPQFPALANKHALNQRQVGDLLAGELRCVACHATNEKAGEVKRFNLKQAPDLSNVGARVSPDYLRRFIESPTKVNPGTTMPHVLRGPTMSKSLNGKNTKVSTFVATAIAGYLISQSKDKFTQKPIDKKHIAAGNELFHSVGCIACHAPRNRKENDKTNQHAAEINIKGAVPLSHVASKYSLDSLSDFLFQPTKVRHSGRMPDMNLTRDEAKSIASFLIQKKTGPTKDSMPPKLHSELSKIGKGYFQLYNCVTCHELDGIKRINPAQFAIPAKPFHELKPNAGCLSEDSKTSPRYNLTAEQKQALEKSIAAKTIKPTTDKQQIAITLATFNCTNCHSRDDFGGVPEDRNLLFKTTEHDLGNEARIPPPLTLVGAKLQIEWIQKVMFDAAKARSYMHTRMPQFGESNLKHLPPLFVKVDNTPVNGKLPIKHIDFPPPGRELRKTYRDGGQLLLGDKGLSCIVCHNFNGKDSPRFKGIDLINSNERLNPSWFYDYLLNPGKHRKGTVMPQYWPGGKAVQTEILKGNTDAQIKAIWYYLSLGRSARDPSGIRSIGSKLIVTDTTRTYRGRSSIAGYRGIAIGFPGGVNYAFNAEHGALTGLWRGEYVNVGWGGQGAGQFNPAGRAISLAQDVAFYRLKNEKEAWPLRPRTSKEQPVNPDPLYPRNRGYQFKGYFYDANKVPTLMYKTGDISIEDRSLPKISGNKDASNPVLARTFTFDAPKSETIWFRALAGKIETISKRQYKTVDMAITVPVATSKAGAETNAQTRSLTRKTADERNPMELLLELKIPKGKSKVTIEYELLR
jgi:mono/diheme cytochrome c family protein